MKLAKYSNALTIFFLVVALFGGFIMVNKNEYGFCNVGRATYFLSDSKLYKIVESNLARGDKVYYYDKDDLGYKIDSDKLTYASEDVFVVKSKPDEAIDGRRMIGKLSYKSTILGSVLNIFSYKINFMILVILPLILLLTYRFYNVISLPGNKVPVKLGNMAYELPALKRKQITRRSANTIAFKRAPIKKRYS